MITQWIGRSCFSAVHQRNLVYNTCWEDPRLDRQALNLSDSDNVLVITSAGCNALDYALDGPQNVFAVDMNPLQNALLELKMAAISALSFSEFFTVFGEGGNPDWRSMYFDAVRGRLDEKCQDIWDKRLDFFEKSHRRGSFYFRGTSGLFAWIINAYMDRMPGLRDAVLDMLEAPSVEHQQEIFVTRGVSELLWSKPLRWALRRESTMAMLGVPRSQRDQIQRGYPGGITSFIQDRIESVFRNVSLRDNYFWRVYLTGQYSSTCCPEYLKPANFMLLKNGLAERISTHTTTVEGFLNRSECEVSRFVLLDHMDWLYDRYPEKLAAEWQSIFDRAAESSRILWRSAALEVDFVDPLRIKVDGLQVALGEVLHYQSELAEQLHQRDRVNTYGSFYITDLHKHAASTGAKGIAA